IPPQRRIQRIDAQQPARDRGRDREQVLELVDRSIVLPSAYIDLRKVLQHEGPRKCIARYGEEPRSLSAESNRVGLATEAGVGQGQLHFEGQLLRRSVGQSSHEPVLDDGPGGVIVEVCRWNVLPRVVEFCPK